MTPDEIMGLPANKGLITVAGQRPVLAKLSPYYKIPSLKRKTELPPASDHQKNGEHSLPQLLNIEQYLNPKNPTNEKV